MMGVIKAKNSAGEWVNVASAEATTIHNELTGELKTAVIQYTSNELSYDLSPYVKANESFILFFVCEYDIVGGRPTNTGANYVYALNHIGDNVYIGGLNHSGSNWRVDDIGDVITQDMTNWEEYFTWDEANRVLTFVRPMYSYNSMGDKALLLYTGVKEA